MDWKLLFDAAGLDPAQFQSATPTRLSLAAFDERAAWTGTWPGTDFPLRVEAAAWRGKPVFFHLSGPWTTPDRTEYDNVTRGQHAGQIIEVIMAMLLLERARWLLAEIMSRARATWAALSASPARCSFSTWRCGCRWTTLFPPSPPLGVSSWPLAARCFFPLQSGCSILRFEPYVRRHWPHALISWSRMLTGNLRDPLVGRDVLWGVLMGVLWSVIIGVGFLFLQREGATPPLPRTDLLMGSRQVLGYSLQNVARALLVLSSSSS